MDEHDLISKRALLHHLDMAIDCKDCPRNADRKTYYDRCACSEVADICNTITDFATFADVQPVRHGRWLGVGERFSEDWECSVCGKLKGKATSSKYCSSCGTKMDIIFQDDKVTAIKVVGWDESDV